jgi:UDP-N-acetyl-2-amino-2-deoxyglucuronate dehydrogenase
MKKLNFAIVGCGRIAERHAVQIKNLATLKAVCDIKSERTVKFGNEYKVNTYTSLEDMLVSENEIEVVSVCTPNGLHAEHTISALRAGCHVLCEKPMATNSYDCGKMIQEAEKANKRLFIVKQNRFNPPVIAVKKAIDEGHLGRILSIQLSCFWNRTDEYYRTSDWKGSTDMDGGVLYTQFSHFIDLLYWLFGDIKDVHAYCKNFIHQEVSETDDSGVVSLRFLSGILGTINYTINSYAKNMEGSLTVFGEKGTVKIGGQYLNELEYQSVENWEIKDLPPGNPPNQYGLYTGSMSNHELVYKNIIEVLQNHGVIMANGYEGLKTVEIIDRIYESSKKQNGF